MASTIKVDNVQNQPGTNIINKCGATITVGAACNSVAVTGNVVKSNALQASDAGNIINQCGTDITLGASGDTIALAAGASQSGFGRTGTVDWVTTVKVTGDSPITGVDGEGYFLNTTAGTITVNLPAGSAGSILAFKDYAGTWDSNAVTVAPNGSEKLAGIVGSGTLSTERQSVTLIYIDSTQGWLDIHDSTSAVTAATYVTATGGNQPTAGGCIVCTNYKVHVFTGPGTFCVSCGGCASGSNTVDYMVVAGGAGSGGQPTNRGSGGGGGGGFRESSGAASGCYTISPLGCGVSAAPVSATPYSIVVGGGGAAGPGSSVGASGNTSTFSTIDSAGGGGGGGDSPTTGVAGGSGGGGGSSSPGPGGAGNTPPTTPQPQGQNGGNAAGPPNSWGAGGSGGGGGGAAVNSVSSCGGPSNIGNAGIGVGTIIMGSTLGPSVGSPGPSPLVRYFSGGGGGGGGDSVGEQPKAGGYGGGGKGGPCAVAGTCNTGGGGGGGRSNDSTAGGSGAVVIRYKFQ